MTRNCNGFAQVLRFFPCEERPNCGVEYIPIPRYLRTSYAYCPVCMVNAGRKRNIYKAASRKATKNGPEDSAAVEKQAESSTMGERKNAVIGGFLPDSNDSLSTSERTSSFSLNSLVFQRNSEIVSVFNGTKVDAPANNKKGPSRNPFPLVTHGPRGANPNAITSASSIDPRFIYLIEARSSAQSSVYGKRFVPPQSKIPGTWRKEQQKGTLSPPPAQTINSFNHEPDVAQPFNIRSRDHDHAMGFLSEFQTSPSPAIRAGLLPSSDDPFLTSEEDNLLDLDPRVFPTDQRRQAFLSISDQILAASSC